MISPRPTSRCGCSRPGSRRRKRVGAVRRQRDDARDRRRRRAAERADGAAQGLRRARLRLLHQHRQREGPRARPPSQGRAGVSLEVAEPAGAPARPGRAGRRRRSRCLFRHPAAAGADRRLGEQAVGAAREPHGVREGDRADDGEICGRRRCRARRTGRAIGSCRWSWSSGTTGRTGCTTGSNSAAPRTDAPWSKTRLYP